MPKHPNTRIVDAWLLELSLGWPAGPPGGGGWRTTTELGPVGPVGLQGVRGPGRPQVGLQLPVDALEGQSLISQGLERRRCRAVIDGVSVRHLVAHTGSP